ncbi:MAG TPA: diacylglycerol kinase family protein [Mesorhizobium sp.]|jgi:diacylglycerol kinase family enzyme
MRFVAVLNRDGGTLRTTDLDALSARMTETLEGAGHTVDIHLVAGREIVETIDRAARRRGIDVIMAGGGDGTISAAAARLMDSKKALAVLPAGTMNLFARSLNIPLNLDQAVAAFANAQVKPVDMALANGRPFIHQFSIGMHAKMVHLREKMAFGSRFGKIRASARAAYYTIKNPPAVTAILKIGEAETKVRTTGIGVTNNLFGEGHLPYADHPDGGVLGIYVTVASDRNELVRFFYNVARGRWHSNPHVDIYQGTTMEIRLVSRARIKCVIDGELCALDRETRIEIKPKTLQVLVPRLPDA